MLSIIKAVPDQLDFQYGFSYLNSVLVLIPRSLYPEKPFVNLDTTIGQTVFGCNSFGACGVPPGLLAESYLNFGLVGLFVMPVVLGLFVGKLDLQFKLSRPGGKFQIFYVTTGLYLGMAILGSGPREAPITETLDESHPWLQFFALCCERHVDCSEHSIPVPTPERMSCADLGRSANAGFLFDSQIFCLQEYGGISRYFASLAREMNLLPAVDASIVAPLYVNQYLRDLPNGTVRGAQIGGKRISKALLCAGSSLASEPVFWRMRPDIVHETYYYPQVRWFRRGIRVVSIYDMNYEVHPELFAPGSLPKWKRRAAESADHVICISENTKRDLLRFLRRRRGKGGF